MSPDIDTPRVESHRIPAFTFQSENADFAFRTFSRKRRECLFDTFCFYYICANLTDDDHVPAPTISITVIRSIVFDSREFVPFLVVFLVVVAVQKEQYYY